MNDKKVNTFYLNMNFNLTRLMASVAFFLVFVISESNSKFVELAKFSKENLDIFQLKLTKK